MTVTTINVNSKSIFGWGGGGGQRLYNIHLMYLLCSLSNQIPKSTDSCRHWDSPQGNMAGLQSTPLLISKTKRTMIEKYTFIYSMYLQSRTLLDFIWLMSVYRSLIHDFGKCYILKSLSVPLSLIPISH